MRWFRSLLVALAAACAPLPPNAAPLAPVCCQPLAAEAANANAQRAAISNDTQLVAEPEASPTSNVRLHFSAPELAQQIPLEAGASFEVKLLREAGGEEAALIDVALDDGRPRRLSSSQSSIALGQLIAADAQLSPGAHWLFAAPVLASGWVPRPPSGAPRSAIAQRFFIGKSELRESGTTGAVWLRKPEGTYNGAHAAERVLFDVFLFSASGVPLEARYTVTLHGPKVSGELRLPSPFIVHDLPSGIYEVAVSAPTVKPLATRFAVNRELDGSP